MVNSENGAWIPGTLASDPDKLVIGLNPPFGTRNALADKFTEHAARSRPRLIALIVPPGTKVTSGSLSLTLKPCAFDCAICEQAIPDVPEDIGLHSC